MDSGAPHKGRGHCSHEGDDLGIDRRTSHPRAAGALGPVLAEAAALPSQNGLRRHDQEGPPPPGPDPGQPDPKRRSVRRSLGRVVVLLYAASCWRRARFSRRARGGRRRGRGRDEAGGARW
jgi:hypothetical protein